MQMPRDEGQTPPKSPEDVKDLVRALSDGMCYYVLQEVGRMQAQPRRSRTPEEYLVLVGPSGDRRLSVGVVLHASVASRLVGYKHHRRVSPALLWVDPGRARSELFVQLILTHDPSDIGADSIWTGSTPLYRGSAKRRRRKLTTVVAMGLVLNPELSWRSAFIGPVLRRSAAQMEEDKAQGDLLQSNRFGP